MFLPVAGGNYEHGMSEEGLIQGKVISRTGNEPLEGVEISVTGMDENYYTNASGEFSVPFEGNEVWISFSYPGFASKEIRFEEASSQTIVLSLLSEQSIDSKIPGFFGDVSKYKNSSSDYLMVDQIISKPQITADQLFQGRLTGIQSQTLSGMPGEGGHFQIRGMNSLFASSEPLILIDGMPFNSRILDNQITGGCFHNPLTSIDLNDIQSIEVIKDGGSLYGIRGGNGIILITTKQPESVSTQVNFSSQNGIVFQPTRIELLNTPLHKAYLVNQLQNTGQSFTEILQQNQWINGNPSYYYYYNYNNETDWQDEIFRPAYLNKFNVSLEGGDEIARFAVLLGYMNQQGVVENTNYQRYNFRLNSNIRVLEKLSMISNVGFSYHISDLNNFTNDLTLNPILSALTKGPMFGPYLRDNQGNKISILSNADEYGFSNPVAIVEKSLSNSFESNFFTNLRLNYQPLKYLEFNNTVSIYFDNIRDNSFIPDYGITDFGEGELTNTAVEGVYKNFTIENETRADLKFTFSDKHYLKSTAGIRISTGDEVFNSGRVFNTPTDEFKSLTSVTLVENTFLNGDTRSTNYSDLFLSNNYRFKDKYMLDLILTLSGSSNTGKEADAIGLFGAKWGFFPSVHGAWLLSSEPFLSSVQFIDLLKLRASYSVTGNDFFREQAAYYYSSRTYGLNSGLVRTYLPNESLKWEEIHQANAGLDLFALNELMNVSVDLFSRKTKDLLVYREIEDISGFQYLWENNGVLNVKGVEISAEVMPVRGVVQLKIGGNVSTVKSTVELDNDFILDVPGGNVMIRDGGSAFVFYGWETNGLLASDAEAASANLVNEDGNAFLAGDVRFVDQNSDYTIDDNDRIDLGNMIPTFHAGIHLSLKWKALSLFCLAQYSGGNKIFNYTRNQLESFSGFENQSIAAYYAWRNESDETDIPRIAYGDPSGNSRFSDRWIEDGHFFRMREITLSYDMPVTRFYKNLRIYLSGQNLFTISNYLGYYPEFSYSGRPEYQSIDYGQIPVTPQVLLGINVGF